jgi:PhnB protein
MKMSQQILSPYINFQGRAREGMEFYQKAFGGTLDLQAMDAKGVAKPAGPGDRIVSARLEADGARIVGTDGHPDFPAKVGENVALAVAGTDKDRLTRIFNALGEGGNVKMPPTDQSGGVGWLTDKFGVNWMVTIHKS